MVNQESRTLLLIILGVAIGLLIILCVICAVFLYRQEPPRRPQKIAPMERPMYLFEAAGGGDTDVILGDALTSARVERER